MEPRSTETNLNTKTLREVPQFGKSKNELPKHQKNDLEKLSNDELEQLVIQSLLEAQVKMASEEREISATTTSKLASLASNFVGVIEYVEDNSILSTAEKVKVKVAMDSGAVANATTRRIYQPMQSPSPTPPASTSTARAATSSSASARA